MLRRGGRLHSGNHAGGDGRVHLLHRAVSGRKSLPCALSDKAWLLRRGGLVHSSDQADGDWGVHSLHGGVSGARACHGLDERGRLQAGSGSWPNALRPVLQGCKGVCDGGESLHVCLCAVHRQLGYSPLADVWLPSQTLAKPRLELCCSASNIGIVHGKTQWSDGRTLKFSQARYRLWTHLSLAWELSGLLDALRMHLEVWRWLSFPYIGP